MKKKFDNDIDALIDKQLDKSFDTAVRSFFKGFEEAMEKRNSTPKCVTSPDPSNIPPTKLYKYIGWSDDNFKAVIDGVIRSRTIRFKNAELFNDPFELNPSATQFLDQKYEEEYLNRRAIELFLQKVILTNWWKHPQILLVLPLVPWMASRYHRRMPRQIEKLEKLYAKVARGPLGPPSKMKSACFSEDVLQPLMWAHYGKAHAAIAIEYDTRDESFKDAKYPTRFARVLYQKTRPKWGLSPDFSVSFGRIKSEDWAYEREWRCLPASDDPLVNMIDEVVSARCITGVYIGLRVFDAEKQHILDQIRQHLPYADVYQVMLNEHEFGLHALKIASAGTQEASSET